MPRVIYAWSGLPEMPDVALQMRALHGWEPVLWLSYAYQRDRVREVFPDVPWQDLEEAFLGWPIAGVNTPQPPALDADLLLRLQSYLPRLLNQMNRFGPADALLYDERESFARALFFQWHEALVVTRPDIVFFEEAPNGPYTYALYCLCLELGIETVFLNATAVLSRSFVQERVEAMPLRIQDCMVRALEDPESFSVAPAVRDAVQPLVQGPEFSHYYMEEQAEFDRLVYGAGGEGRSESSPDHAAPRSAIRWFGRKAIRGLRFWIWIPARYRNLQTRRAEQRAQFDYDRQQEQAGREVIRFVRRKLATRPFGAMECTVAEFKSYTDRARAIKEELRADYNRRCTEPDLSRPYVYFPLHYRPERTSNPDGGVFYDQIIPINMISDALPEGWAIYVKEHPTQFSLMLEGECGRTSQYYDELAALRGVQFVSEQYSSKALLMNAKACATITGTIGWEGALNHRPVIYFGFPWYQGCPGTVKVGSAHEISAVFDEPEQIVASEDELEAYLSALTAATFLYAQTAWVMDPPPATAQQQVEGMVQALSWWHEQRHATSAARTVDNGVTR